MFNLKFSGIFALVAFILSLLLGLLSHAHMPMLIIRPLIFAVIFFLLSIVVKELVSKFLPELLEDTKVSQPPGSRVNITDDGPGATVNEQAGQPLFGAKPDDSEHELGDISQLSDGGASSQSPTGGIFSGMDQNTEDGYNKGGEFVEGASDRASGSDAASSFDAPGGTPQQSASGGGSPRTGRTTDMLGSEESLPDLDSMAGAFVSAPSGIEEPEPDVFSVSTPSRKASSGKSTAWAEDFNAKDIAEGIRTVLIKDKEG